MDENRLICENCGAEITGDGYTSPDGDILCEDCFDEQCTYCDECGEVIWRDDVVPIWEYRRGERVAIEYVCAGCADNQYFRCHECGEYFEQDSICIGPNINVCWRCYEDGGYITCEDCGDIVQDYREVGGCCYCDSCADGHRGGSVQSYSYKPSPVFLSAGGDGEKPMYFGVELEVDDGDDPDELAEALDRNELYCKEDGSLGSDGVEIVTHPATLDYHMGPMGWDDICETCKEHGYRSHDTTTCGLHIHIGRDAMADGTPERMVALVDALWPEIVKFSRRDPSRLQRWAAKPDADIFSTDDAATAMKKAKKTKGKGRYQAINLTNANTVELRFFRGSLVPETIKAALQLANALVAYADAHSITECQAVTWGEIAEIAKHPEFKHYCERIGLVCA